MQKLPTISRFQVYRNTFKILKNPLPFHRENYEKYGDTFVIPLNAKERVIFTRDFELTKHVLQTQQKHYYKSRLQTVDLAKYVGHGLLTSNGEPWRAHRRMIQPAFHKKKLEGLLRIMQTTIEGELNGGIRQNVEQDIFPLMHDLAFQVVAKCLFSGSDLRNQMSKLQEITQTNQRMLIREMRQPYLKWWFHKSGQIKKHLGYAKEARDLLKKIIEERKAATTSRDDLLDMLLAARYEDGGAMAMEQLIDEVLILFIAGHETSANALSFALFLIAKHPETQKRIQEELQTVSLETDDLMQLISKLSYTKQCIEEAMRLYPPAYIIDRVAITDDDFKTTQIPKGTYVLLSIYELHRHRNFWESPEEFNPDRFHPSRRKNYSEYYYPFGGGPRMCIGNSFAMYEMVLTLATIFKQYTVSTTLDTISVNPLISLKPQTVPLTFKLIS